MRTTLAFGLLGSLVLLLLSPIAGAEDAPPPAVTDAEVRDWMDMLPSSELGKGTYKWSRVAQATPISRAISLVAPSREDAAYLTVYDVLESGNRVGAVGDGGGSHGPWQLSDKRVPPEVSRDPVKAARAWLKIAQDSRAACADRVPDEQLAALASGNCSSGLSLVRRRAHFVRMLLGEE